MPTTIYKYEIPVRDQSSINMPAGAKVLSVGVQNSSSLMVWAIVDPRAPDVGHIFYICGTGHSLGNAEPDKFIGTAFMGPLVWHVFDGGEW